MPSLLASVAAMIGRSWAPSFRQLPTIDTVVQYVEEPTASVEATLDFSRATGIPVALDESLDEALRGWAGAGGAAAALRSLLPEVKACSGVAAVVVKPAVIGGFEAASLVAGWARARGVQVAILTSVTCKD